MGRFKKKLKIGIIIQARTNSSRLKKKVLKKLDNRALMEWVILRCKNSSLKICILATSNSVNDNILLKFSKKYKIFFFRGSEKNVLSRFYHAAKKFNLQAIIRVCADNPFVDPKEINVLVKTFKNNLNYDYFFNHRNFKKKKFADGFGAELITFNALKKIYLCARKDHYKEHVTSYIWDNFEKFKILPCKSTLKKKFNNIVLDINTFDDYHRISNFILKKKINIYTRANNIALKYSNYIKAKK